MSKWQIATCAGEAGSQRILTLEKLGDRRPAETRSRASGKLPLPWLGPPGTVWTGLSRERLTLRVRNAAETVRRASFVEVIEGFTRALELIERYDAALARELPTDTAIFDAHLH